MNRLPVQSSTSAALTHHKCSRCAQAASAPPPPKFHLLEYKYVPDILEKRGPYRADHIAGAKAKARNCRLQAGGGSKPVIWLVASVMAAK